MHLFCKGLDVCVCLLMCAAWVDVYQYNIFLPCQLYLQKRQTDRQADRQADMQTDIQADRQTGRQTDIQTDRQTEDRKSVE